MRKMHWIGWVLILFAAGNIAYDVFSPSVMGALAVLVTAIAAASGTALVIKGRPIDQHRQ